MESDFSVLGMLKASGGKCSFYVNLAGKNAQKVSPTENNFELCRNYNSTGMQCQSINFRTEKPRGVPFSGLHEN